MKQFTGLDIKRINFIEFNAKVNTLATINPLFPKYGTTLLSSLMRDRGYDVKVYLEGISDMDFSKITDCDLVCLPVFAPALNKVKECAQRIKKERPDLPVIMGGPQVCFFPETVVDYCDIAVRCEGDDVLPEIVECINDDGNPLRISGISYKKGDKVIHNPKTSPPKIPPTIPDLNLIDGFEKFTKNFFTRKQIVNTLQTTRGCKFKCKFCPTQKLFQGQYRNRDIDSIIEDIKQRKKHNEAFFVVDNDFCSDKKKTRALLNRIIEEDLGVRFTIFERHEIGRDEEMLELFKRAGIGTIIVGVESLLDNSLDVYNKNQTKEEVLKSIKNIQDKGIHVLATFVLGCDEDTVERVEELIKFINDTKLSLNLFIMHDLEEDESKGLMIPLNRRFKTYWEKAFPGNTNFWDYGTGSFVTYFPKRMKPSTLQKSILRVYDTVYSHKNILRNIFAKNLGRAIIGVAVGYGIKRMNKNTRSIAEKYILPFLEEVEKGLYDENEVLIEEKLKTFSFKKYSPLPPLKEEVDTRSYAFIRWLALTPGLIRYAFKRLRRRISGKKGW